MITSNTPKFLTNTTLVFTVAFANNSKEEPQIRVYSRRANPAYDALYELYEKKPYKKIFTKLYFING